MRTYPPAGIALTPYSVSPLRTDHRRGPKPTKYSVTFMPAHLAVAKCPSSCSITITMRMAMKRSRSPQPSSDEQGGDQGQTHQELQEAAGVSLCRARVGPTAGSLRAEMQARPAR